MTTLSVSKIRLAVAKLKKPDADGNYHFIVPITPMTEQKFADFNGYGINTPNEWITHICAVAASRGED